MSIIISNKIKQKLLAKTPPVTEDEVEECFANVAGPRLIDKREAHRSDPATRWFIAETNMGRKLKVAYIQRDGEIFLRTAYDPNQDELSIYSKYL